MSNQDNTERLVLAMAKRIQWIEHGGRHTWETCMSSARARALDQARACLDELRMSGAEVIFSEARQ